MDRTIAFSNKSSIWKLSISRFCISVVFRTRANLQRPNSTATAGTIVMFSRLRRSCSRACVARCSTGAQPVLGEKLLDAESYGLRFEASNGVRFDATFVWTKRS